MNCFLQFKQKAHYEAYTEDMSFSLSKRAALMLVFFLIYTIGGAVILSADTSILPVGSKLSFGIRIALSGFFVTALWILKWKAHLIKMKLLINLLLDVLGLVSAFSYYPLFANVEIDKFGVMGTLVWGWSTSAFLFSVMILMSNWWIRAISTFAQMIYFLVWTYKSEKHLVPITVFAAEAVFVYACAVYVVERYDRLHFLNTRKIQENLEATKKIFDNICEGIVIFDKDQRVLYANKAVSMLFGVEGTFSAEKLFQHAQVRSIHPEINERVESMIKMEQDTHVTVIKFHLNDLY